MAIKEPDFLKNKRVSCGLYKIISGFLEIFSGEDLDKVIKEVTSKIKHNDSESFEEISLGEIVPVQAKDKYSKWLTKSTSRFSKDYTRDIRSFLSCYRIFYGVASVCNTCYGQYICEDLNKEFKGG